MQDALDAFHSIASMRLRSVLQGREFGMPTTLVLRFDNASLFLRAGEDFDTLEVSLAASQKIEELILEESSKDGLWQEFIGKRFGWGWITANQQGYRDGALLSFEGIVPQIFVYVMASTLKFGAVRMTSMTE